MKPRFFRTPAAFRSWLEAHHATDSELLVGFYKKGTGRPSITWPEAVDQALCFGWIDGFRHDRRLATLIEHSEAGLRLDPLRPGAGSKTVR
jgi:uncharacterized protein YdeI (YjbR/CyaY-like superfamily)